MKGMKKRRKHYHQKICLVERNHWQRLKLMIEIKNLYHHKGNLKWSHQIRNSWLVLLAEEILIWIVLMLANHQR